jgi:hypothetical protein
LFKLASVAIDLPCIAVGAISLCGPWRFALLIRECLSPHQSAATRRRAALHHGLLLAFDGMLIVAAVPLIVSIYRLDHLRRRLRQIASTYREEDARRWAEQAAPPPFTLLSVTPRLAIHGIGFKVIAKKDKGFGINRLWLDIEAGPSMPQKIPTLLTAKLYMPNAHIVLSQHRVFACRRKPVLEGC